MLFTNKPPMRKSAMPFYVRYLLIINTVWFYTGGGCGDGTQVSPQKTLFDQTAVAREAALQRLSARLPDDAAPIEHQVFRYLAAEPKSMDMNTRLYGAGGSEFLFERLCMFGLDGELLPGAASHWESSEDNRTWTFYLRPEAMWSDGRPVTAHDFEYTFRRFLHPDAGNVYAFLYYDIKGAKAYNQREITDVTQVGVRALDGHTFVIETELPCAFLPYITAYHTSSPAPRWQIEKHGDRWSEAGNCVSNSAYQVEKWLPGQYLTFGLNPYYDGPNPGYLRQIVRVFTGQVGSVSSTNDLGLLPYENNEIDVIEISPMMSEQVKSSPGLSKQMWRYDQFSTIYLYFKTREAPFNDVRVRQAFAHAIDKEALVRTILKNTMIPAYTMLPRHFPGNVGSKYDHHQAFNVAEARRLLADAGYPDGRGFPVKELWLADATASSAISQSAQAIQEMLKQNLNVDVKIRNTEGGAYRASMYNWEMPMSIIAFAYDFPDPHSMLGIIWRSQPRGYTRHDWQNERFDQLIDDATGEMDPARRMGMYDEAEGILAREAGAVFLWHVVVSQLRKPWVKGFQADKWGNYPNYRNGHAYYDIYIGHEVLDSGRQSEY